MIPSTLEVPNGAKVRVAAAVVLGFLASLALLFQSTALAAVVASALESQPELAEPSLYLFTAATLVRAALLLAGEVVGAQGAVRAGHAIRERLFAHLLKLGPSRRERAGDLAATLVEGPEKLHDYFARYLPQVALSVLVPLVVALYVLTLDWVSGVILLATGPAIPLLMVLIGKDTERHTRERFEALRHLGAHFLTTLRALPTLKAFGRAEEEEKKVARASEDLRRTTLEVLRRAFLSGLVLEFISTFSVALVAVTLAMRLLYGSMTFEVAFLVLLLAPEFFRPLRELGQIRHSALEGKAAAARISNLLEIPLPTKTPERTFPAPSGPVSLDLEDLRFTYPGAEGSALRGVNLHLEAGTRTVLVGPSGAGKSTLVELLARFYEPSGGRILANGVPLESYDPELWRRSVALVPQRPYLFAGSVRENLLVARPEADREELERAARLAGAFEFIERLPEGFDTPVGERGARLSEGQVQRIALARAFLKDAPVLVLDEPSSSLDPETERRISDALNLLTPGRAVLVVAHRLNLARAADRVAVMEGGRIVQSGTHSDLASRPGPYADLERLLAAEEKVARSERTSEADEVAYRAPDEEPGGPEGKRPKKKRAAFVRLLGFLGREKWRVALSSLLAVWTVGANVGLLAASGFLVALAAQRPPLSVLIPAAFLVQILGGSRGFTRYGERIFSHDATFGLLSKLRVWLYGRLAGLSPAGLTSRRGGDLLARVIGDVEGVQNFYLGALSPLVVAAVAAALTLFVGVFSGTLAAAALFSLAFAGVATPLLVGALEKRAARAGVDGRAALSARVVEGAEGVRDLLAFGLARKFQEEVAELDRELGRSERRSSFAGGLKAALDEIVPGLAVLLVLVLAFGLVSSGSLAPVYLPLVALATLASFEAVRPLGEAARTFGRSLLCGERVFEVADQEPPVEDPPEPLEKPSGRELRYDRVSFGYTAAKERALEDVSLALRRGRRVAVVGPSGAGKSTLVNLALRFWDVDRGGGEVLLDGEDLKRYAQSDARAVVSVASQEAHVLDGTLRENLLLARPDAREAELWAALQAAQLARFVEGLSRGLDEPLYEGGLRLSGGERRRVGVARALLKEAPFVLLDEPTADLDAATERALLDAVLEATRGRGLLLITHRLVRLEEMDEILVLERGRVVERGTHAGLLARDKAYKRMFDAQQGPPLVNAR